MNYKDVGMTILFQIILPTWDSFSDWYIIYQLLMGYSFVAGQQCCEEYIDNHIYFGIAAMLLPCMTTMSQSVHWWDIEGKEKGAIVRLMTFPFLTFQIYPQFLWTRWLKQMTGKDWDRWGKEKNEFSNHIYLRISAMKV